MATTDRADRQARCAHGYVAREVPREDLGAGWVEPRAEGCARCDGAPAGAPYISGGPAPAAVAPAAEPGEVQTLCELLRITVPVAELHVDAPAGDRGEWWVTVRTQHGFAAEVSWRAGVAGYACSRGEGRGAADVVVSSAAQAALWVATWEQGQGRGG